MARSTYPLIVRRDKKYKALADLGLRLYQIDKSLIATNLVDIVPSRYLQLLGEKWSVLGYDGWSLAESDAGRRSLIKHSVELHRRKGTPWSIREIVRKLGFGEVDLQENLWNHKRDGSIARDGTKYYGDENKWAHYRVILKQPITNDQAAMLREVLQQYAPARCVLESLDYRTATLRHNGVAIRDGSYNRGVA